MAEPQRRSSRSRAPRSAPTAAGGSTLPSSSTSTEIRGRSRSRGAAAAATATNGTTSASPKRQRRRSTSAAAATRKRWSGGDKLTHSQPPQLLPLRDELPAMALLTLLYAIQGIPLGLTMGSVPFLLRDAASLSAVGAFSTAAWPYAAKLAWSPVVDATTLAVPVPRKALIFLGAILALLGAPLRAVAAAAFGWGRLGTEKGGPLRRLLFFFSSDSSSKESSSNRSKSRSRSAAAAEERDGDRESAGGSSSSSSSFYYLFADSPRKSWIIPVQLLTSALLLAFGPAAARAVATGDVPRATLFFFALVLLAATQDVAVDGWALTLLSRERVGWASTCQTVGTNLGFFASFTALLALGDPGFCARWVFRNSKKGRAAGAGMGGKLAGAVAALAARARSSFSSSSSSSSPSSPSSSSAPVLWNLGGYLLFWGWAYLAVTLFVAVCVPERKMEEEEEEEGGGNGSGGGSEKKRVEEEEEANDSKKVKSSLSGEIALAYRRLADVMRLPAVQRLCLLLLTCRLAILPAEAAAALALSEKGVPRQALAGLVLLQLPAEAVAAFLAGRAAGGGGEGRNEKGSGGGGGAAAAWVRGYWLRLVAALATTALVVSQPNSCSSTSSSSSSCLTPLRFSALALAGLLTAFSATLQFTCMGAVFSRVADPRFGGSDLTLLNSVANLGITLPRGLVLLAVDALGLGKVSTAAVVLGACAGAAWYSRELPRLEALPTSAWRAGGGGVGRGGGGGNEGKKKK